MPRAPPFSTQYGGTPDRAAIAVADDASANRAEQASSAVADSLDRRSMFIGNTSFERTSLLFKHDPSGQALAPVSRPNLSRRGRNVAMVVDVLHAVSVQVGRRLQARLIVEVSADLRRGAAAL